MNTLYVIHISSGLPRQRTWRGRRTVVVTGATEKAARTRALVLAQEFLPVNYRPRVEDVKAICRTPDDVLTGAIL